jgi:hypothetical protein
VHGAAAYSPFFSEFIICRHLIGLLGWRSNLLPCVYLHKQQKHRVQTYDYDDMEIILVLQESDSGDSDGSEECSTLTVLLVVILILKVVIVHEIEMLTFRNREFETVSDFPFSGKTIEQDERRSNKT